MKTVFLTLALLGWTPHSYAAGPHELQTLAFGEHDERGNFPRPGLLPEVTEGPRDKVYGYLAYWDNDLNSVPWDDISGIALFNAEVDSKGVLTNTSRWDLAEEAVAIAAPYGVRVHLCVTNFSPSSIESLLSSASARATLIESLKNWVDLTGVDGINIDFEGLPYSVKSEMVTFTKDLEAAVGDVVLATPAVDWDGSWDFDQLNLYADMFIMAYDYHWSGSAEAGPVDPLYGGGPWGTRAIDWTIADYLTWGADPDRLILGLPLYGKRWDVDANTIPAAATSTGTSVLYAECQDEALQYGVNWEPSSETPYWYDGSGQGWYSNVDSLQLRIQYALDEGLVGVGFWALNYDDADAELWRMIRSETTDETDSTDSGDSGDTGSGTTRAEAGLPLLAYVGDTVTLNGTASAAANGGELGYSWVQVLGPAVTLANDSTSQPSLTVGDTGTHSFALTVTDDDGVLAMDTAYVVVIDPNAGRRYAPGCGCQSLRPVSGWALLALVGLVAGRRRARPLTTS